MQHNAERSMKTVLTLHLQKQNKNLSPRKIKFFYVLSHPETCKNYFFEVRYTATTTFLALDTRNQNGDYHYYFKYRCLTLEQGKEADCAYDKVSIQVKGQYAAQGRIPTSTEAQGYLNPRHCSEKMYFLKESQKV